MIRIGLILVFLGLGGMLKAQNYDFLNERWKIEYVIHNGDTIRDYNYTVSFKPGKEKYNSQRGDLFIHDGEELLGKKGDYSIQNGSLDMFSQWNERPEGPQEGIPIDMYHLFNSLLKIEEKEGMLTLDLQSRQSNIAWKHDIMKIDLNWVVYLKKVK